MREHDNIIGRRILYHTSGFYDDLTCNKEYIVLDFIRNVEFDWSIEKILLTNDEGIEKWYSYNLYGIYIFTLLSGQYVEYIGKESSSYIRNNELSHNKWYELFDRCDYEYYYFIDNKGKYVGILKYNFKLISLAELREIRIKQTLDL
jgi:hypothetical protein